MADLSIAQQAQQAAQQGQQLLSQDKSEAATAKGQYNTYSSQATSANKNLQSEAAYMQGAGSGQNVYNSELGTLEDQSGYNPQQLGDANKSLFGLTGALNSTNAQFNTAGGVGAYGVSAPALASYESSILNPLQTGVNTANSEVGALNTELGTMETGANQATSSQVQGEQNTVTALIQAAQNYQAQAASALQNMQFYSQLAQQQGGLNAQQQQLYAASEQAYAAATASEAQAGLYAKQAAQVQLQNQQTQAYMNSSAYQNELKYGSTTAPKTETPSSIASGAVTGAQIANKNANTSSSSSSNSIFNHPLAGL